MVKRVGVLSNPRSGTSLMVRLLVLGFDLDGTLPLFPHLEGKNIYEYRADIKDLVCWVDDNYYTIMVIRDPRAVVTSKHPSDPENYFIDFEQWYLNYKEYLSFKKQYKVLEVRYEDLLNSPEMVQNNISIFLDVPINVNFNTAASSSDISSPLQGWDGLAHEMGSPRPLDSSHTDRWKSPVFASRIKEQINKYPKFIDILLELGYEKDNLWLRSLDV